MHSEQIYCPPPHGWLHTNKQGELSCKNLLIVVLVNGHHWELPTSTRESTISTIVINKKYLETNTTVSKFLHDKSVQGHPRSLSKENYLVGEVRPGRIQGNVHQGFFQTKSPVFLNMKSSGRFNLLHHLLNQVDRKNAFN